MLYREHGGNSFFTKNKSYVRVWLASLRIPCPDEFKIQICSFKEYSDLNFYNKHFYVIFYCPGSLIGEGKECFSQLCMHSSYQIGCCDHYTNVWQRFSDEKTGELFKYTGKYLLLQSPICYNKVILKGFAGVCVIHESLTMSYENITSSSIDLRACRSIIFITEWYLNVSKYAFEFDQNTEKFQSAMLQYFSELMDLYPQICFGIRKHPHLKDCNWKIPSSIDKKTNFRDFTDTPLNDILNPSNIFVGIDSIFLLHAVRSGCLVYSLNSEKQTFYLSHYDSRIVNITSIFEVANENL